MTDNSSLEVNYWLSEENHPLLVKDSATLRSNAFFVRSNAMTLEVAA